MNDTDYLCINTPRFLAVDAVEEAHSGSVAIAISSHSKPIIPWMRS